MNRENVLRVTDELRLLFATRIGQKLTAGQIRQIIQSANANSNSNENNSNRPNGQMDRYVVFIISKRLYCIFCFYLLLSIILI